VSSAEALVASLPRVSLIVTSHILPGTMILIAVSILLGSGLQDSGLFQ
jgi:hypothetical protein